MTQIETSIRDELAKRSVAAMDLVAQFGITRQYAAIILKRLYDAGECTRRTIQTGKQGKPAYLYQLAQLG